MLTAIAERGINVKAYESYAKEGYRKEHDMSIKSVIEAEIVAAERGEIIGAHFGIVCSSSSDFKQIAQRRDQNAGEAIGEQNITQGVCRQRESTFDVLPHYSFQAQRHSFHRSKSRVISTVVA